MTDAQKISRVFAALKTETEILRREPGNDNAVTSLEALIEDLSEASALRLYEIVTNA